MKLLEYLAGAIIIIIGTYIAIRLWAYGAVKSYFQAKREEQKMEQKKETNDANPD